ncbi:hypothetical protein Ahy_B06g083245 [Arachis hypogaea]|uniref:Uncharacterized protein n=1 Tax=Arachis hypogaea TaxID=3818 RepID=A0A444YPN7_ARAHY|nr:hypothetical protein Ahy_B06g083245 [Arachis hypogaea]
MAYHAKEEGRMKSTIIQKYRRLRKLRTEQQFHFRKRWLEKQKVSDIIKVTWRKEVAGSSMFKLAFKLRQCHHKLVEWQKSSKTNSQIQIAKIQSQLEEERAKGDVADGVTIQNLKAMLKEAVEAEEKF